METKAKRLEGIVEISQIANCTANAPLNEKLQALEELHGQYNVHMLCDALKSSPRNILQLYLPEQTGQYLVRKEKRGTSDQNSTNL